MNTTLLIAFAVIIAVCIRALGRRQERCPDCNQARQNNTPICECGWIFEVPDDDEPLQYGDPEDEID